MKKWKVLMLENIPPYTVLVQTARTIDLGNASNKFDVMQELKKRGEVGEIINIQEVKL